MVVSGMGGDMGTAEPFEALSHQMWVPSIYSPSKNVLRAGAERMRHSLQQGGAMIGKSLRVVGGIPRPQALCPPPTGGTLCVPAPLPTQCLQEDEGSPLLR